MIFHRYSNSFIMMLNNRHSSVWDQDESSVSQRSHGEYKGNHSRLPPRQIGHSITPNIAVSIFKESETRVDSDPEFQGRGTILNLHKSEESLWHNLKTEVIGCSLDSLEWYLMYYWFECLVDSTVIRESAWITRNPLSLYKVYWTHPHTKRCVCMFPSNLLKTIKTM